MAYKNPLDERARAARRKHYEKNRPQYYANNKLKRTRLRQYIIERKNVPCMDCSKSYPYYVMDFDHRDRVKKLGNINLLLAYASWKKLTEEIKKCDVVCSNCHRIRTAKQLGYDAPVPIV